MRQNGHVLIGSLETEESFSSMFVQILPKRLLKDGHWRAKCETCAIPLRWEAPGGGFIWCSIQEICGGKINQILSIDLKKGKKSMGISDSTIPEHRIEYSHFVEY